MASKLYEQKKWKAASSLLMLILEAEPNNTEAKTMLAECFLYLKRPNDALLLYDMLIENDPENPHLIAMRGHSYMAAGRKDLAMSEIRRSISIRDSPELRGYLYTLQGRRFEFLEIKGMGRRFKQDIGGHTTTFVITDFLEKIVTGCITNSVAVKVDDILQESEMTLKNIVDVLPVVEGNTSTKATFIQIDQLLLLEFVRVNRESGEKFRLTHLKGKK